MFRPQFTAPPPTPPPGFVWQPCVYEFDPTNTPAFAGISLSTGQETGYIPLTLDSDAPFYLLAIKIEHTTANFQIRDPQTNELIDAFVPPELFASNLPPAAVLEMGVLCPKGSVLEVKLQGQ